MASLNGIEFTDIHAELKAFKQSDDRRDQFIQELVQRYHELQTSHRAIAHDFENEKQSRRAWQERVEIAERNSTALLHSVNNNCFALALIDGDGAIFQDALLERASDGGSDAAHKLNTEIRNHLATINPLATQWSVCVQIFVNLEGLAKKLFSCGIIKSGIELQAFVRAFNLHQSLFNIVDVGFGKERADHKIKETLRLFIANQQCTHIILGGIGHDNGYLPNLDQWRYDQATYSRISLLETTPITVGFSALNFRPMRCPSLFRSEHLPAKPTTFPMHPPAPTTQRPAQAALAMHNPLMATPATTTSPFVPPTPESPQTPQLSLASDPLSKALPSNGTSSPTPSGGVPVKALEQSWATVGQNGKIEKNYSIAPAPKKQRPFIVLNKDDERLDIPINRARANFDGLEQRIRRTGKVCNSYHLTGVCHNMYCDYDHQPRLSEGEQIALRTKARQKSCPVMLSCRDPTCINGHQCTWGANCTYGDDCFFAETHQMDRTPTKKVEIDDAEI